MLNPLLSRTLPRRQYDETIYKHYLNRGNSINEKKQLSLTNPAVTTSSAVVRFLKMKRSISSGNLNINPSCTQGFKDI
jgi:hypothetical protein